MSAIGQKHTLEKKVRPSVDSGDFAAHVERELSGGSPSPGAVMPPPSAMHKAADFYDDIRFRPGRSKAGWFLSILSAAVFSGLAYLALTQERIVLGARSGDSVYEGLAANVIGFILLAVALLSVWRLTSGTRFSRPTGAFFLAIWIISAAWYSVV